MVSDASISLFAMFVVRWFAWCHCVFCLVGFALSLLRWLCFPSLALCVCVCLSLQAVGLTCLCISSSARCGDMVTSAEVAADTASNSHGTLAPKDHEMAFGAGRRHRCGRGCHRCHYSYCCCCVFCCCSYPLLQRQR